MTTAGYKAWAQALQMLSAADLARFVDNAVFAPETNLVPQEVGRGEVAMGLVEETKTLELVRAGYPVKLIYPQEGVVPTVDGWALARNRPHSENGKLFAEFMNSLEGQNINRAARNRRVGRKDANQPTACRPCPRSS